MSPDDTRLALERTESALRRRPGAGPHEDTPARVRWDGGLRTVAQHPSGLVLSTDMPAELGGDDQAPSPGWHLRHARAACTATRVAMAAARAGIELSVLEVQAGSRSDTCGLLGLPDAQGEPVSPAPQVLTLQVRIAAAGVSAERLQALVSEAHRLSPVDAALQAARPVTLSIELL